VPTLTCTSNHPLGPATALAGASAVALHAPTTWQLRARSSWSCDRGGHRRGRAWHPKNSLELKYLVEAVSPDQALRAGTQCPRPCLWLERESAPSTGPPGRSGWSGYPLDDFHAAAGSRALELCSEGRRDSARSARARVPLAPAEARVGPSFARVLTSRPPPCGPPTIPSRRRDHA